MAFSEIDMGAWRLAKRGSAEGGAEALRGQARGSRSCQRGRFAGGTRGAARARRCRRDRRGGEIIALLLAPGGSRGASRAIFQARKSPMRIAWGRFPDGCGARLAHCYLGHVTEAKNGSASLLESLRGTQGIARLANIATSESGYAEARNESAKSRQPDALFRARREPKTTNSAPESEPGAFGSKSNAGASKNGAREWRLKAFGDAEGIRIRPQGPKRLKTA